MAFKKTTKRKKSKILRRKTRTFRKKVKKMKGGTEWVVRYVPIKRSNLAVGTEYFKKINSNGTDSHENFVSAGSYLGGEFVEDGIQYAKFKLNETEKKYIFNDICDDDTQPGAPGRASNDNYLNNCRLRGQSIFFYTKRE
jgi:hypothetical protein